MRVKSSNPHLEKNELREKYKSKRAELDPEEKRRRDKQICEYAVSLASFRFAGCVLLYAPLPLEVDILSVAKTALALGKKVYFPRCEEVGGNMSFRLVSDLSELKKGKYGILEPSESAEVYDCNDCRSAACFIPALIYDKSGYRVGYGKGYYDRFLCKFKGSKIGVIYSDFIIDHVPRGYYDLKVDIMLTERNVKLPYEN